ncbi:MAG: hypothetical protein Ta2B_10510 [Termitinemataceae bacterium]|nr:MAG: hypothetical protein Ta2B_10510 [Termitinemataceae bacterium]
MNEKNIIIRILFIFICANILFWAGYFVAANRERSRADRTASGQLAASLERIREFEEYRERERAIVDSLTRTLTTGAEGLRGSAERLRKIAEAVKHLEDNNSGGSVGSFSSNSGVDRNE